MLGLDLLTVKRRTLLEIWARTPRVALASLLICFLFIIAAAPCWADEAFTKAARNLAQKIAAQIDHKKKVLVEVVDLTKEMRATELDDAKKVTETELQARGLRTVEDASAEVELRITLSRNNAQRILIADFDSDGAHAVLMEPFDAVGFDAKPWASRTHVDRELVFSGNLPILDFACTNAPPSKDCGKVLVLSTSSIVLMDAEQNFPRTVIPREGAWSRDLRGRIKITGSDFEARIEDEECSGNITRMTISKCAPANGPWTFTGPGDVIAAFLGPTGNWFQWTPGGSSSAPNSGRDPFFSIAGLQLSGEAAWISTGVRGETRAVSAKNGNVVATTFAWGSELATVKTDCGSGWQILSTSKRDHTELDSIAVYEWAGNEFRALSDPLELDGPVVAMWSGENSGPARAVVRNLKTGNYEAYLLKVGCSQ